MKKDEFLSLKDTCEFIKKYYNLDITERMLECNIKKISSKKVLIKTNEIFISKEFIMDNLNLYINSIKLSHASKIIQEKSGEQNIKRRIDKLIRKKVNVYLIELVHHREFYLNKEDFELIIKGIIEVKEKECISMDELVLLCNKSFPGIDFATNKKRLLRYIQDNKLEVIDGYHLGNFLEKQIFLYPKETIEIIIKNCKMWIEGEKVKLINLTHKDYYNLTNNNLKRNYYKLEEVLSMESFTLYKNFQTYKIKFSDTNVKVIFITKGDTYISKKEYDEYYYVKKNYAAAREELLKYNVKFESKFALNNNIDIKKIGNLFYINKNDVKKYISCKNYINEFNEATTIYQKVKVKTKQHSNENEKKYPIFISLFWKHTKNISYSSKSYQHVARLYNLYNIILDNLKKDIDIMSVEELNKLFKKLLLKYGEVQNYKNSIIQFINFIAKEKNIKIDKFINVSDKNSLTPYTKEQFITLLIEIINIITNPKYLKKTYRNWGISSSITYVFLHYSLAWRRKDLIENLPKPNLKKIIGFNDGEKFLQWLEDGNSLDYELAKEICDDIEDITKRLRKETNKTKKKLTCIISNEMCKEVALLLCINEANRLIQMKNEKIGQININNNFIGIYTQNQYISRVFLEEFDLNIFNILGEMGFDNRRMNKGFLSLVKEKAEELGLAYGYYYAQRLRSHYSKEDVLSNTTKIYLDKDVSEASVKAFSMGTMGSISYNLNKLILTEFDKKKLSEQIDIVKSFPLSPYGIEKVAEKVYRKIIKIEQVIDKFLLDGGYKEGFLKELLYGQNSYGIDKQSKCLLKVIKNANNNLDRIEINKNKNCSYGKSSCIGCDYLIGLRYFLYEFNKKFNKILIDLEVEKEMLDREIIIESINELYIPIINDMYNILGDEVMNAINIEKYMYLCEQMEV